MEKFNRFRPRDINLEIPISDKENKLKYYMFSPSFFNSFQKESFALHKDKFIKVKELQTKKLSWVLDTYLNREIDFLTIDVEGMELEVLKSNNWKKYRPKVIVFELFASEIESVKANQTSSFLKDKGYSFYCFSKTNVFFIENEFYKLRFKNKPISENIVKILASSKLQYAN